MAKGIDKRLNVLHGSPSFCFRIHPDGSADVVQLEIIPDDEHEYWVHATATLPDKSSHSIVLMIARGGGEHLGIYFRTGDGWISSGESLLLLALNKKQHEIFPFDWEYSVPVANDIFHT